MEAQKKIAVINDFCGFGRCSLAVSLPMISAMKLQCCPLPTSIFSNHTGYDSFYYTDFTAHMQAYMDQWEKLGLSFDGILTGFLGSVEQIDLVCDFMQRFKGEKTVTVIDPVMGDDGALYATYSPLLAQRMRELLQYADILTPNFTEACILSGREYVADPSEELLLEICQELHAMGPKEIVISGLECGEDLENFIYTPSKASQVIREHKTGPCRAGTGDVFASILAARAVQGVELARAVEEASAFIAKALRRTMERNVPEPDGICFEEFLYELGGKEP
ncbi:MAG: pyridoxamine kinase [Oscillospiraceae bacterium]|nr:pyridoxamine kinase [Oscillospiraceae bacterium]